MANSESGLVSGTDIDTSTNRNIQVNDILSGVTIYLQIPDDYETLLIDNMKTYIEENELDSITNIITATGGSIYFDTTNGLCYGDNSGNVTIIIDTTYFVRTDDYSTGANAITLPDDFGTVTEIDENAPAYSYFYTSNDTTQALKLESVTMDTIKFINKGDDGYEGVPINAENLNKLQSNVQTSLDSIVESTQEAVTSLESSISSLGNVSELTYSIVDEWEDE